MISRSSAAISILLCGSATDLLEGQSTNQVPELMALTQTSPMVLRQDAESVHCRSTSCSLRGTISGNGADLVGGTAWDTRQSRLWVTNGSALTLAEVRGTGAYGVQCPPIKVPVLVGTSAARVTGLAYYAGGLQAANPGEQGVLFLAYTNQYLGWAASRGCRLIGLTGCSMAGVLGANRGIGALAIDGPRGFLFLATSRAGGSSPVNIVYVTRLDQPGVPVCKFSIVLDSAKCSSARLGPISGIAYDVASGRLFVTDGKLLIYGKLALSQTNNTWAGRFAHGGCCRGLSTEPLVGLSVAPPAPVEVGRSCVSGSCSPCTDMRNGVLGDAVLGNSGLFLTLTSAPSSLRSVLLGIGFGPCSPTGLGVGLCGPVRIAMSPFRPLILGLGGSGTGSGCSGTVRLPLSIPVNETLLDVQLSTQWVLHCPNTGSGTSNCLQIRISG